MHYLDTQKILLPKAGRASNASSTIELPPALRAIADLLGLMGQQQPIMLIVQKHELTTQEAAGVIGAARLDQLSA